MFHWLKSVFDPIRPEERDAAKVYAATMAHSRNPIFFGDHRLPDSYDGRIGLLTLHLSIIMVVLREFDENGQKLSQSIYDHMIDDFDVALREEGLSDTGVKKRMKTVAATFFTRAKTYSDAMETNDGAIYPETISQTFTSTEIDKKFREALADYATKFHGNLKNQRLGQIAKGDLNFPNIKV